jgi:hypothetical protein
LFWQPSVLETNKFNAFSPGYIPYGTIADANALAHIIVDDPNVGKYTESLHNDRALFRPRIDKRLLVFHFASLVQQMIAGMKSYMFRAMAGAGKRLPEIASCGRSNQAGLCMHSLMLGSPTSQ